MQRPRRSPAAKADVGRERMMRGVRHFQTHRRVLEIAGKWLYCTVCGSLRPKGPNMPWFQPGDDLVIREWTIAQWGLDPYMLSPPSRLKELRRVMPTPRQRHVPFEDWREDEVKDIVALRDSGKYSFPEIAEAFGASTSTIRRKYFAAVERAVYWRRRDELFARKSVQKVEEEPCPKSA